MIKKLQLIAEAIDKQSGPFAKMIKSSQRYSAQNKKLRKELGDVSAQQRAVKQYHAQKIAAREAASRLSEKREVVRKLNAEMRGNEKVTKAQGRALKAAVNAEKRASESLMAKRQQLAKLVPDLKSAGVHTKSYADAQLLLQQKTDRLNASLNKNSQITERRERMKKARGMAGEKLRGMGGKLKRGGLMGAGIGAGAGFAFNRYLVQPAAEFEKYQKILETTEGSQQKANKAMDWVLGFAAKTPYEMNEVTQSFVKMRSYGLEPTGGLLQSLGDTASAMGKPMMQAIEAMADAVTGENERLKEFGIKARAVGDEFVYEYTQNGKTMTATAKKNSREQIQATLQGIFDSKYAGQMKKMSSSYAGMTSNLSDHWLRFRHMIMASGVFDFLKGELGALVKKLNEMAKNGQLKELAESIGTKLVAAFKAFKGFAVGAWGVMKKFGKAVNWVAESVGGYENLAKLIAGLMVGKWVFAFGKATGAVGALAFGIGGIKAALISTGIGALLVGLGMAAYYIYENWESIGPKLKKLWADWGVYLEGVFAVALAPVYAAMKSAKMMYDWFSDEEEPEEEKHKRRWAEVDKRIHAKRVAEGWHAPLAYQPATAGGQAGYISQDKIDITVQAAPGMNEQEVARVVVSEMQKAKVNRRGRPVNLLTDGMMPASP